MVDKFTRCMPPILAHEGGKCDIPGDPGGRTNQGVTQGVYDAWRTNRDLKPRDVYMLEPAERDDIYRLQYWDKIRGDSLPDAVAYVVFDGAVNSGPQQSVKWLQRALGFTGNDVDGSCGEKTIKACFGFPGGQATLVRAHCARRLAFLKQLKTWKQFGKGWARRVAEVEKRGLQWAMSGTPTITPATIPADGGQVKATIQQAEVRPSRAVPDAITGSGIATGTLGGALAQAKDAIAPFAATGSSVATNIVMALVLLGLALTVGGVIWAQYQKLQQKRRADALDLPLAEPVLQVLQ